MPRTVHSNDDEPAWSSTRRVVFRVFFIYTLLLYIYVGMSVLVPDVVMKLRYLLLGAPTLSEISNIYGSLLVSAAITVVWSLLDRKRVHYAGLYRWLRTAVRYFLAFMMLIYGVNKLVFDQLAPPSID